jgi:predicted DNA-binding transcriptional regulator AlpA
MTQKSATSHNEIPDALRNFDTLPDSANVRQPVLEGLFACSHSTIWRRVRSGTLPTPRKLSARVTTWNVGDLRRILAGAA